MLSGIPTGPWVGASPIFFYDSNDCSLSKTQNQKVLRAGSLLLEVCT